MQKRIEIITIEKDLPRVFEEEDIEFAYTVCDQEEKVEVFQNIINESPSVKVLVILDIDGGNTLEDAFSLVKEGMEERFACGYIRPKKKNGIGAWAFERNIIEKLRGEDLKDIKELMAEIAQNENLGVFCVSRAEEC